MKAQAQIDLKGFISRSPAFKNVIETANKIAGSDFSILIEGEVGVGKEWLARAIHFASPRTDCEFVVIDCSSFSDVFLEAELFGYMRGSFAGAIHEKKGMLEVADGGTVLIDHIAQMKPTLQGKFLRLIQEGTFHKLGGVSEIRVNVRFIAATDQDLKVLVSKGKFRPDLYYQLNAMRITIPPLRERSEDIFPLADWFLSQIALRNGAPKKELTQEVQSVFKSYEWPGNVSELEREIERSAALAGSAVKIGVNHLSRSLAKKRNVSIDFKTRSSGSLKDQKRKLITLLEASAVREALRKTGGNRTRAARILAISRQELLRKISSYKIKIKA